MRVFAVSDIHVDFEENMQWVRQISTSEYQEDILILAGDVSDNLSHLEFVFTLLSKAFRKVMFVPGNHELWMRRCGTETSYKKFELVMKLADGCGIVTKPYHHGALSIVPLFSWYDYSFGEPCADLKSRWMDYRACVWPVDSNEGVINDYFLERMERVYNVHAQ